VNIILLTKNIFKENEIRESIKGFGFNLFISTEYSGIEPIVPGEILSEFNLDHGFILREETRLENERGEIVKEYLHLDILSHFSKLKVIHCISDIKWETREYNAEVKGFIDINRSKNNENNIYNWDDIFVCINNMKSYYEMRNRNKKFSARQIVMSDFLNDFASFENKVDLRFNPFSQENVTEFSDKIYSFINENKYLSLHKKNEILNPLMKKVMKDGIFTRSSLNKKQRNYWYPSLNAGLPLVPKKDHIHEVTFMFHDLMHHLIPDLIMTGEFSENNKETYVIHRMISEAFTIVLADMVFIDQLVSEGVEYDWEKRRIYPVYRDMKIETLTIDKLKEILWANVRFALLGDYTKLHELSSEEALSPYINKYEKFFIEDYRWTINNFDNMSANKVNIANWFEKNKELVDKENTINHYSNITKVKNNYDDKVKVVFEEVFSRIKSVIDNPSEYNFDNSNSNSFKNYMIGQSIVFFNYSFHKDSDVFSELISTELKSKNVLSQIDIIKIRSIFNLYLAKLKKENIISKNDMKSYKEIVPFFEAFYVFYDKGLSHKSVKEVVKFYFEGL
jgi:hypothetical protein